MDAHVAVAAWLLMAINAWGASPIPKAEVARAQEVRERAADSIMAVAYDEDEPPLAKGPYARARTALLFTSIFGLESRFVERVITGHCAKAECDNGTSWGMGQMKVPPHGFRLVGTGFAYCFTRSPDCWSANELIDDWKLQVRSAFHMYRTLGPSQWTTASAAAAQAKEWLAQNPAPARDDEVMQEKLAER